MCQCQPPAAPQRPRAAAASANFKTHNCGASPQSCGCRDAHPKDAAADVLDTAPARQMHRQHAAALEARKCCGLGQDRVCGIAMPYKAWARSLRRAFHPIRLSTIVLAGQLCSGWRSSASCCPSSFLLSTSLTENCRFVKPYTARQQPLQLCADFTSRCTDLTSRCADFMARPRFPFPRHTPTTHPIETYSIEHSSSSFVAIAAPQPLHTFSSAPPCSIASSCSPTASK